MHYLSIHHFQCQTSMNWQVPSNLTISTEVGSLLLSFPSLHMDARVNEARYVSRGLSGGTNVMG